MAKKRDGGDDSTQCQHLVGKGKDRHLCRVKAVNGGYCGIHRKHPARRVEERLSTLHDYVQDSIRELGRIVTEGEKEESRLKAAIAILDRTGHGPSSTVTVHDADARLDELLRARGHAGA